MDGGPNLDLPATVWRVQTSARIVDIHAVDFEICDDGIIFWGTDNADGSGQVVAFFSKPCSVWRDQDQH